MCDENDEYKATCDKCKGKGYIYVDNWETYGGTCIQMERKVKCPKCSSSKKETL